MVIRFTCARCASSRLFDPQLLPFGDLQPVLTINRRMKCGTCGWDGEGSICRPETRTSKHVLELRKVS